MNQEIEGNHVYLGQRWVPKAEPTVRYLILNRWDRQKDELFLVGSGEDEEFGFMGIGGKVNHRGRRMTGHTLVSDYQALD